MALGHLFWQFAQVSHQICLLIDICVYWEYNVSPYAFLPYADLPYDGDGDGLGSPAGLG